MAVVGNGVGQITALVHTHGARLVRLAHLLGVHEPERVAADAMAGTSRGRRRSDAHEELLTAARRVGDRGTLPVRDDAQLQSWLDRAELEPYEVDVGWLWELTQEELQRQEGALRRRRLRWTAGAAAAVLLAAASMLWPGDGRDVARMPPDGPTGRAVVPTQGPFSWPGRRPVRDAEAAGVVLRGPAITIMQTSVYNDVYVSTLLAVSCTSDQGVRAICIVFAPPVGPLSEMDDQAVAAFLPVPPRGDAISDTAPSVLRDATTRALTNQTLMVDATSPAVDAVRVTYTDGSVVVANRYDAQEWGARLFLARNKDVQPVKAVYLDSDGRMLARRSLYTAAS